MSLRRRGNVFADSALASSPDFDDQAPNNSTSSSYPGTRYETTAALIIPDGASDDPPYIPTTGEEDPESRIHEDEDIPARSPRRSKRLRPFYATSKAVVRERLLLIQTPFPPPSSDSEEESEPGNNNQSSEVADDDFPAAPTTLASENTAHESASVSVSTPRAAHRRKQNRPFRCPVM